MAAETGVGYVQRWPHITRLGAADLACGVLVVVFLLAPWATTRGGNRDGFTEPTGWVLASVAAVLMYCAFLEAYEGIGKRSLVLLAFLSVVPLLVIPVWYLAGIDKCWDPQFMADACFERTVGWGLIGMIALGFTRVGLGVLRLRDLRSNRA